MTIHDVVQSARAPERAEPVLHSETLHRAQAPVPSSAVPERCEKCGAVLDQAAATLERPQRFRALIYREVIRFGDAREYRSSAWMMPLCASCASAFVHWMCQWPDVSRGADSGRGVVPPSPPPRVALHERGGELPAQAQTAV